MDKETAVEIERLKSDAKADRKRIDELETEVLTWKTLVRAAVIRVVKFLLGLGMAGLAFGWNLPENTRKAVIKMLSE